MHEPSMGDRYYLEKDGDPTLRGDVDHVTFDELHVFTVEIRVVRHYRMHRLPEFRVGGRLGIALVRGEIREPMPSARDHVGAGATFYLW